jgi:hypothetical protein
MLEQIDEVIHFSQIKAPKGVTILNPAEEVVVRVVAKKAEPSDKAAAAS